MLKKGKLNVGQIHCMCASYFEKGPVNNKDKIYPDFSINIALLLNSSRMS